MNLFGNDLVKGMVNVMSNNSWSGGSASENTLRNNLQRCTYPDETKWMIQKAAKQLFHVYPFFKSDILMFTQNSQSRRYIELKGILQIEIKGKTCKVDFNMMLPFDYPRSPPFVRIVNRNPDYVVDPFYQSLKSKTDPSSYVLNQKLSSVKAWQPSSSLVNVVIQCYDTFKGRFPFSKPVNQNISQGGNAWDALYNSKKPGNNNNFGGGGFNPQPNNDWNGNTNANTWGNSNNNNWGSNQTAWTNNNNNWGGNKNPTAWNGTGANGWGNTSPNNAWGGNNNAWGGQQVGNNNGWGGQQIGGMGGMGGIVSGGASTTNTIASAQKLVGKQKQTLAQMNTQYVKIIEKVQLLDVSKQSLESEQTYLRTQNFDMAIFLKENESSSQISSITSIVRPKDEISEQILDLLSGIKARQQCTILLEAKFTQEQISLQEFLKYLRKIQEAKFQQKILLHKCIQRVSTS